MNKQLLGFKKVDIQFKLTKLNSTERVMHSIFIKKHSSRSEEFPSGKTLFIVNIPVDFSQQALTTMFAELGEIVKVKFQAHKKTGTSCHVIFKDSESVDMILEDFDVFDASTLPPLTNDIGLSKFLNSQQQPDINNLKEMVDTAMELFHDEEMQRKRALEESRNVPDEDGFVTVTRKGRKTNQDAKGGSVLALRKEDAEALKPKEHGLVDFYRFQQRERKRNELAELRRKFEQDKEKIQQMKESRKFKPY